MLQTEQTGQKNVNSIALLSVIFGAACLLYFFVINRGVVPYPQALALARRGDLLISYEYLDADTDTVHYAAAVPAWHGTNYRVYVIDAAHRLLPLVQKDNIFTGEETAPGDSFKLQYRAVRNGIATDQRKTISLTTAGEITAATFGPPGKRPATKNMQKFFTPNTQAATYAAADPDRDALAYISNTPQAVWLLKSTPNLSTTVAETVRQAAEKNELPVFTLYYAARFDCASYISNKQSFDSEYEDWVQKIAAAIGENKAMIVLEPDALAQVSCIYPLPIGENPIAQAVAILKAKPHISVYVDAGHPNWISSTDMATRLENAGINTADGFSLNVSNFISTPLNVIYGISLSPLVHNKHFIIDTSRNGAGAAADNEWCNPPGRGLGTPTTDQTPHELVDALVWIKNPGESDGTCNGGPQEGAFWPEYAVELYNNRK